jgi:hypothetical protein
MSTMRKMKILNQQNQLTAATPHKVNEGRKERSI